MKYILCVSVMAIMLSGCFEDKKKSATDTRTRPANTNTIQNNNASELIEDALDKAENKK